MFAGYEWNRRSLDERQRLLTEDLEERIWWMFLIYWAIWTLIRQNYFRMLSAGPSQDVGSLSCPNLPDPALARVHSLYMHNIQMCIPHTNLCTKHEHIEYTHWLGLCEKSSISSLLVILCSLKKAVPQSFVWLDAAAQTDAVFSFRHVFTQTCV